MSIDFDLCASILARHPYPLLFATVSGAHLYGFPSEDSDYDLRGVHLLPAADLLSLETPRETVVSEGVESGIDIDLVTHDARKFAGLMLKRNGYVLEQLLSPLIVRTTPEHRELVEFAAQCLTRNHAHHYLGFAETQWTLVMRDQPPRVKPLLYVYRVLLTGIHLMRAGVVEANLPRLNAIYALPCVEDLIARKSGGREQEALGDSDLESHGREYQRLRARLEAESSASALPEAPSREIRAEIDAWLVRIRLQPRGAERPA